jgi:Predicted SPOUT methyltransferase
MFLRVSQRSAVSYSTQHFRTTTHMVLVCFVVAVLFRWLFATTTGIVSAFAPVLSQPSYRNVAYRNGNSVIVLCMGLKVTIRIVGRKQGGEKWLDDACDMYLKRLKPTGFEVVTEWYKNNAALVKVQTETSQSSLTKYVPVVLLDPTGLHCTSEKFADYVYKWLEEGGCRLVFVIGGGTN